MKKSRFIIILFLLMIFVSSCGKKSIDRDYEKEKFLEKGINIIKIINTNVNINFYKNNYNKYVLENNRLIGKNFNTNNQKYEENINMFLDDYQNMEGLILQNYNNEYYLSLRNDKYCLVKDYLWQEPMIYSIEEEKNCHLLKTDMNDNEVQLGMFNYIPDIGKVYVSGTESNYPIVLQAINNIYDSSSILYKWYRNDIEIENSDDLMLRIEETDDAVYYAILIVDDIFLFKTDEVHVIINR